MTTTIAQEPRVGSRLPNGALVLATKRLPDQPGLRPGAIVLAYRDYEHPVEGTQAEFITWTVAIDGPEPVAFWGHYFPDLEQAFEDFTERSR